MVVLSVLQTPNQNVSWAERLQNVPKGCKMCRKGAKCAKYFHFQALYCGSISVVI